MIYNFLIFSSNTLIVSRLNESSSIDWYQPCSSVQYDDTSTTDLNAFKAPLGINGDQSQYWQNFTISTSNTSSVLFDSQVINPAYTYMKIYLSYADIKSINGTCYKAWSIPTVPTVTNRTGSQGVGSGGFTVSSNNYSYALPVFTQCQNLAITLSLTVSPSTALPSYMSFNNISSNPILYLFPNSNTQAGVLTLRYTGTTTYNSAYTEF